MTTTRPTRPTGQEPQLESRAVAPSAPVATRPTGAAVDGAQPGSGTGEGESGASGPIHPFPGHCSDGSDYYSSGVYVNSDATSSSRGDASEHLESLGFWCDCNACLAKHEQLASAATALRADNYARDPNLNNSAPSPARVRDPATVTDIADARQRALPTPPVFLGDFRGRVPQRRLPPHFGLVLFTGWALVAIAVWLAVR